MIDLSYARDMFLVMQQCECNKMLRYKKVVTTKVIADYFWRVTVEICGVIKNNKLAIFSKLSFFFQNFGRL